MIEINSKCCKLNIRMKQLLDLIYLCILGLYLIRGYFHITMFSISWPTWYSESLRVALGIFLIIKIVINDARNIKAFLFDIIYLITFYFIYKGTGYISLLELGFFVLGAKDIPYQKIIKLFVLVITSSIVITILGALTGCVQDLIFVQDGMFKHAFGIAYTTDFGAHVLFLVLAYLSLREKAPGIGLNAALVFLAYILYRYSGTRCSSGCMVFLVLGGLYIKYSEKGISKTKKVKSRWNKIQIKMIHFIDCCLALTVPIFALLTILLTTYFTYGNVFLNIVNQFFSGRLGLGKKAIQKYGFSFWGSPFDMIGVGSNLVTRADYNFIDSSYVMICVRYGIVLFFLAILGFLWLAAKTIRVGRRYMLVILAVMAVHSVVEHHLLDISCNPFVLLIFANFNSLNRSESIIVKDRTKKIVKYCVAIVITFVLLISYFRIFAYGRTIVTLLKLNKSERNIYFILAVLAGGIICILTLVMLWNLYLAIIEKKRKYIFLYSICSAFCIIFFISGMYACNTIVVRKSIKYRQTIEAGKMILEQLNQVDDYKLYVDDIPYLYMKDKEVANDIIPGTPYRMNVKKVVVITKATNEMTNLLKAGYLCGQISDTEYLYTNDKTVANIVFKSGIKMTDFYARKQSVNLKKMAKLNKLSVDDNGSLIIKGSEKSMERGSRLTIYSGTFKVNYDLELLETDISDGGVAILRLTSYNGAILIKEVIVNKSDFDENGHCIISLESYIPDSVGVEFLIVANDNTKLKLNNLTYEKVGKN